MRPVLQNQQQQSMYSKAALMFTTLMLQLSVSMLIFDKLAQHMLALLQFL